MSLTTEIGEAMMIMMEIWPARSRAEPHCSHPAAAEPGDGDDPRYFEDSSGTWVDPHVMDGDPYFERTLERVTSSGDVEVRCARRARRRCSRSLASGPPTGPSHTVAQLR